MTAAQQAAATQQAAWWRSNGAPLTVDQAPVPAPGVDEIVVANRALAMNPVDWIIREVGRIIFPRLKTPFVLGSDLAGEVVQVGESVTRFAVGDRVLGHAAGIDKSRNSAAEGSFQEQTIVLERMASPIPDAMSYTEAAVLPLGISTAACALFQDDHLALAHPRAVPVARGETVLIWGGSTSVGCNAIQLAVAAGYEVVTTASPANADFVRGLGATQVFDYHSPEVITQIVDALQGVIVVGAVAIGPGSAKACADVVARCQGRKFVSIVTAAVTLDKDSASVGGLLKGLPRSGAAMAALAIRTRRHRVKTASVFGTTLLNNDVCQLIYRDFLPAALADGRYQAAPTARVVGHGLPAIQDALDQQKNGVSATKIVVTL